MPLTTFKVAPPDDVFDSYTVERRRDGTSVVHREYSTPSGDWLVTLTYNYAKDGKLRKVKSVFVTFGGITSTQDAKLTRCTRTFTVSRTGELQKTSEQITDVETGEKVARQFWHPQVDHWMSLDALPLRPKT